MKILTHFDAGLGRKDFLNSTFGKESLHEISNDNEVR
jgi:hypothetical protein